MCEAFRATAEPRYEDDSRLFHPDKVESSAMAEIAIQVGAPYFIAHRSSQTADTLNVAGTLALYPNVDVIVVHVGALGTTEGLLNIYRQATDPSYPKAAISPVSAATNKRVKVVYASNEAVAGGSDFRLAVCERDIK